MGKSAATRPVATLLRVAVENVQLVVLQHGEAEDVGIGLSQETKKRDKGQCRCYANRRTGKAALPCVPCRTQGDEAKKQKSTMGCSKKRLRHTEPSSAMSEKVCAEPSRGVGPPSCATKICLGVVIGEEGERTCVSNEGGER